MCGVWSRKAAGSGRWGRQLGGGGHDRGAVQTRAGRGRFERPVLYHWAGPNSVHSVVLQLFKLYSDFKIQSEDHPDIQNY
jgi:hypothetical protein